MPNKLQELTDRLYQEGLSKGKEEGEALLVKAKEEAASIRKDAQAKAKEIIDDALKQASDIKKKAEADIRMASQQSLAVTKGEIEALLTDSLVGNGAASALSDTDYLKEIISAVAAAFDSKEARDMNLVLPEKLKGELEKWVSSQLKDKLSHGVSVEFSKKINAGFTIGPADKGYFISFTEESFKELIKEYLRPLTRKIVFGE